MEYLDIYDENKNYLGKEERNKVHRDALWHNTVHCWLYDGDGNIYFQIREDSKTFYTTASGHVMSGESIKEAFGREIKEEIGIDIEYENAELVDIVKFILDRENKDGSYFRDRAFANVYVYKFDDDMNKFNYDEKELDGVVKVNAKETLDLFNDKVDKIDASIYKNNLGITKKEVTKEDFLLNKGETLITKYGDVLNKVIKLTN
jgi:isopentenyldiphosphate isomerase